MLKATTSNVTKLSEDSLYIQLSELKESDPMYSLIEAELDRRAEEHSRNLQRRQMTQLESLQLTQAIQNEIHTIFAGYKGKKTLILIEALGQEYIEDYTIDEETFTVYSKVSHEIYSNPSSWEFDSIEKARCKMAMLIYYRIYNKFLRDATSDNLELLKRLLGGEYASGNSSNNGGSGRL